MGGPQHVGGNMEGMAGTAGAVHGENYNHTFLVPGLNLGRAVLVVGAWYAQMVAHCEMALPPGSARSPAGSEARWGP